MKRINKINKVVACLVVLATCLAASIASCTKQDEFLTAVSTDKTKPDPIKDYKVVNFNGGAYIIYQLPKVDNILYVQGNYDLDGGKDRPIETRASYFTDTLVVNGFKSAGEYDVELRVVSRAEVQSDPITVKVQPTKPIYQLVAENLTMEPDFQGVRVKATNVNKKNIGVVFLDNFQGKLSIRQQNFSDFEEISFAVRGYDTVATVFAAYITDKWGNRSDTIFTTVKPLFERTLDKSKFFLYQLPSETPTFNSSYVLPRMWDGNYGNFWHTKQNDPSIELPLYGTFGLGTFVKLSRFKFTPRRGFEYRHGQARVFSLWGSAVDKPGDFVVPLHAPEGTRIGDWINLGNFNYPDPPSGASPGSPTDADKAFFNAGAEFEISFTAPKVKYLRFSVSETWVPGNFTEGGEFDVFGDNR